MRVDHLFRDLGLELDRIARGATHEHRKLRKRVGTALLATFVVDMIGSGVMYSLDAGRTAPRSTRSFRASSG